MQKDESISALLVQVVDIDVLNVKRIYPETEGALITGSLDIVV
jgi:hypothetical protein